jgi:hypothetical protein
MDVREGGGPGGPPPFRVFLVVLTVRPVLARYGVDAG